MVATWGSLGDLHPYLAIAIELQRRGHGVVLCANAQHREKVESFGLPFAPLRPTVPEGMAARRIIERAMHPWRGSQWLFQSFLDPAVRDTMSDLEAACEGADLLFAHAILLPAPLVAFKKNIPFASGVLAPISLWSPHDPPVAPLPGSARTPGAGASRAASTWGHLSKPLARLATRGWFGQTNILRREMNISTRSHPLFDAPFRGRATLALFSRFLGEPQSDWPRPTIQCGVPILEQPQQANQPGAPASTSTWSEWIDEGEPPIVWTLGSTAVHIARGFWRVAFYAARDIFRRHGVRSLFLAGQESYWRLPLPDRSWGLALGYAPFESLFSRASAIVHQGGVGTTQSAMRAGAPQIIVPWAQDQPDNAARIQARGLGLALPRSQLNFQSATRALEEILLAPKYLRRAREVAQAMRQSEPDPAGHAASTLASLVAPPSTPAGLNPIW